LEKARLLPLCPGSYLMRDGGGKVIYVGKSKALKNRVSSYFKNYHQHNVKTKRLVDAIRDFECIFTSTESEALILENELIKLHQPKYNIRLKDDKSYPYVRLSVKESFPRLSAVRQRRSDGARYFGPYSSLKAAQTVIDTANGIFSLPVCRKRFPQDINKERPCLYYHMGRCMGVCTGSVTEEEYALTVDKVSDFLREDHKTLASRLTEEMNKAGEKLEFERAAKLRDCIRALEKVSKKQQIVRDVDFDADVFGYYSDELGSAVARLIVRGGRLIDSHVYHFGADEILSSESFTSILVGLYREGDHVPFRIYISPGLYNGEDEELILSFIEKKAGHKVKISVPERADPKRLVELGDSNAREAALFKRAVGEKNDSVLVLLQKALSLEKPPVRIEAIDISNSGDENITAGIITVLDGKFSKKDYKYFNVSLSCRDDVGSMEEAYYRRMKRARDKDEAFSALPDLILADGAANQVNAVKRALEKTSYDIPVFGMVKDLFHKTRCLTDGVKEISIAKDQTLYGFIYRIQEEVHRFAFSGMDRKRQKSVRESTLETISGIGPAKAKALMRHFKSLKGVYSASLEELCAVEGISKRDGENIIAFAQTKKAPQ